MGHADLAVCTRGRGAAVITVGQKDCACVHRRGGFRDRLPSHGRGICFYRVGGGFAAAAASRFSPDGEAASGGHISFCEERNVGKKVA